MLLVHHMFQLIIISTESSQKVAKVFKRKILPIFQNGDPYVRPLPFLTRDPRQNLTIETKLFVLHQDRLLQVCLQSSID